MLRFENVSFGYTDNKIINNLSFQIKAKQHTAIVGASGCGKSTILRLICGLEQVESGDVFLCNNSICNLSPSKRQVGILFQDYSLFPHLTVAQNILFANKQAVINDLLAMVNLQGYDKRYPHELSGGQQQRVALVRALATNPRYLLLDEPFANLDPKTKNEITQHLIDVVNKTDTTLVLVSHDMQEVNALCKQVIEI